MPLNWASNNGSRGEFYTTRILSDFYSRRSFPFLQTCTSSESHFILFSVVQVRYLISSWVSPPVHPGHVIIPQMFTEPLCGPSALSLHLPHLCHGTRDRFICMHLSVYRLYNQLQIVLKLHTRLVWVCLCGVCICVHVWGIYTPTPIGTEARGQQLLSFPLLFSKVFSLAEPGAHRFG